MHLAVAGWQQTMCHVMQTEARKQLPRCGLGAAGTCDATASADTQQALHLFFQRYATDHADELANTCVLLICEGIASGVIGWHDQSKALLPGQQRHSAVALHMQCKFVMKLLEQSDLPAKAVHEAVCANTVHLSMPADAIARWLSLSQ